MKIQESAENYLETILILLRRNGNVRSIDIANEMGFSKPSISNAMKQFRENGYIVIDDSGHITLTETGLAIAERTYHRHKLLTRYLMALGVSEETAKEDACKIEHYISEETFNKICENYKKISNEEILDTDL
ncbi:MAG: metal-dependent transcriptional regulator [Clostridiaceae bacterium]|nr:metal-dependent transcriptional regulator [Clostridiaceae bacterium]